MTTRSRSAPSTTCRGSRRRTPTPGSAIVIDAQGRDVSSQPNAVVGLAVRWTIGEVGLVSWGYTPAAQGGPPTRFDVIARPRPVSRRHGGPGPVGRLRPRVGRLRVPPGRIGDDSDWTIGVRAVGSSDSIVESFDIGPAGEASGVLAPVDGLVATASA